MRDTAKVWTFVCLGLFFARTILAAPPDWLSETAERLFQRVYAQPTTECPSGLDGIGDAAGAVCATYERGIERLKKTLKQFDNRPNRAVTREEENEIGPPSRSTSRVYSLHRTWCKQGNLYVRDWLEDDELMVIAYDEIAGRLAVLPRDSD